MGPLDPGRAGPFGERQAVGQPAVCVQHVEPVVPCLAVLQHCVACKQAPLLELPALAGPEGLPGGGGQARQAGHLIKSHGPVPVALDKHPVPLGIQVVFEPMFAGPEQGRAALIQQVLLRAVVVVALQHQVAVVRGAIEAEQPGGIGLLVHQRLLAVLPGPQLPGAQGAGFVGNGVEGLAIQAPEQIAGPVGQGGERLAARQIQHCDAVVPIPTAVFGQGKQAAIRVQCPGGKLVVPLGGLTGGQSLAGGGIGAAALPQAAVRRHAPLAARLSQPLFRHGLAPLSGLPLPLQRCFEGLLGGELLVGPAILLAQQRQQIGGAATVVTPAAIGIEAGYLPLHQLWTLGDQGRGLLGCLRKRGGQQAGQYQQAVHQIPTKV